MINKWIMKETNLMKRSLEKWGRAPIILGGASTHLFGGSSTHYFKRARAPIIQEGTSTHYSKTTKQRTSEQMQNGHERNKFMKCCLEKMRARTHYFRGHEHPSFWGLEHPLFQEGTSTHHSKNSQTENKQMNAKWTWKKWVHEMLSWKNEGAHPLFLRARAPIILGARALII
jgi:hypothetical protein